MVDSKIPSNHCAPSNAEFFKVPFHGKFDQQYIKGCACVILQQPFESRKTFMQIIASSDKEFNLLANEMIRQHKINKQKRVA